MPRFENDVSINLCDMLHRPRKVIVHYSILSQIEPLPKSRLRSVVRWRSPITTLVRGSVPLHRLLVLAATIAVRLHLVTQVFLAPVVCGRLVLHPPLPLQLSEYDRCDVCCANNCRNDCIGYDGRLLRVGKSQSQTTVDDAEKNSNTADRKMEVRGPGPVSSLLEHSVVDQTQDWLGEQNDKEDDTNHRVCIGQKAHIARKPDANTKGGDIDRIRNQLERSVDPDKTGK